MPQKREMMRIIAGKYKRRLIYWPEDPNIRPTKDRIREAIFAALGDIEGKVFLDLYAGSGSMGLEAISRGAKKVYFVDRCVPAIKCIKENINVLDIKEDYELLKMSDKEALNIFKDNKIEFDIIFLDPPYEDGQYEEVIEFILNNDLISSYGIIIAESDHQLLIQNERINRTKEYKYGDILVTFYGV